MNVLYEAYSVSDFALPHDTVEAALLYPGPRPDGSFITDGETVTTLPNTYDAFVASADNMLTKAGLPLIADRIPVLAYGANASPHKLLEKMDKFGDSQVIPHCAVVLPDALAVWHGQPGQLGSYFAELYTGPEAKGASLQAHVGFVTLEQLGALDASEGVTYTKFELPAQIGLGADDPTMNIMAYVALDSKVFLKNGAPALVASLDHRDSQLERLTAREALAETLDAVADATEVPSEPEAYVQQGTTLNLDAKKERQARVGDAMADKGMSRPYSLAAEQPESKLPRLDFADLPGSKDHNLHVIPQMVWSSDEKVRINVNRARLELSKRIGEKILPKVD